MAGLFQILNISRLDMLSRLNDLDVVSNNLANVNTTGFKRSRANFQELLDMQEPAGNHLSSTQMLDDPGSYQTTTNPLDLAIQGQGYFAVTLADGTTAYTRDGRLSLDADNRLVTAGGRQLVWQGQIPPGVDEIQVRGDGQVYTRIGEAWTRAGAIQLARFINPSALQGYGENLWLETPASGTAQNGVPGSENYGALASNTLEQSNVNLADEMTHLVSLQRAFEMSVKTFQQTDEMITQAIQVRQA
ncbi:MAG: flagellar hook-basal body complex protein [Chloroflexi bacterium]|nr:flagellar hook-basal body complex protein [Chloroflexota bacterium]